VRQELDASEMNDITAIILAGGKGERMKPYNGAKVVVPVLGRPLLHRLFNKLASVDIRRAVVCVGHCASEVVACAEEYASKGQDFEVKISNAGEDASHGARLSEAYRKLETKYAIICYGDLFADIDLEKLYRAMVTDNAAISFLCATDRSPFGVVRFEAEGESKVIEIAEKPSLPHWINIGFALCHSWALLKVKYGDTVVSWMNRIAKEDKVVAVRHRKPHYTMNTERERVELEQALKGGEA
jgi:NDP-sugar pyrophosphorylase family protein